MEFRTTFPIPKFPFEVNHKTPFLLLGSCFSDDIGNKLRNAGFNATINLYGTMFNPISISKIIDRAVNNRFFDENDFLEFGGKQICFDFPDQRDEEKRGLKSLNARLNKLKKKIKGSNTIFVTLGSAWIYRFQSTGEVVANCHKIPQKHFSKELLSVDDVSESLKELNENICSINPRVQLVLTVSPVRHLKDGIHENQLSKSTLLLAIDELIKQEDQCHYFPSYELVMDDLRGYRFFKKDFIHPNVQAIDYVWEKFQDAFFDSKTIEISKKVERLNRYFAHQVIDDSANKSVINKAHESLSSLKDEFGITTYH